MSVVPLCSWFVLPGLFCLVCLVRLLCLDWLFLIWLFF